MEKLIEELEFNSEAISNLLKVLEKSPKAREDVWNWSETIVDSLEFGAHRQFEQLLYSGVGDRIQFINLYGAYRDLKRLRHNVKQSVKAHLFLIGYTADQSGADKTLGNIQDITRQVAERVSTATKDVNDEYMKLLQDMAISATDAPPPRLANRSALLFELPKSRDHR